ncbi:MAG: LPXTG cell wall anchor domain-containing protein [Chloroflexota bacterium]
MVWLTWAGAGIVVLGLSLTRRKR